MKQWLSTEWSRLINISESAELYNFFFRGLQTLSVLCIGYFMLLMLPMFWQMLMSPFESGGFNPLWMLTGPILALGQMALAEYALRCVQGKRFRGVAIGLALALTMLPSWVFPGALFGLYSLLNEDFQRKHMQTAPKAFLDLLTRLKINYVSDPALKTVP